MPLLKELSRVYRAQDQVKLKTQNVNFLVVQFYSILVKVYENVHFTEFHSILYESF